MSPFFYLHSGQTGNIIGEEEEARAKAISNPRFTRSDLPKREKSIVRQK